MWVASDLWFALTTCEVKCDWEAVADVGKRIVNYPVLKCVRIRNQRASTYTHTQSSFVTVLHVAIAV